LRRSSSRQQEDPTGNLSHDGATFATTSSSEQDERLDKSGEQHSSSVQLEPALPLAL
jgi:hypothetical protein